MIYFIRATVSGTIKIGVSNDPKRRLESMQTGSPEPLELLGILPGGVDEERRLHRRFSAFRIHGEWFRGDETLAKAIDELVKKPIDELLDEKSAEVWLIAGELLCEHDDDWEPITLFCVRRSGSGRLFPDPDLALDAVRPGCRFRVVKTIADLSSGTKHWPIPEARIRQALAPAAWKPVVFDCDDYQPFPTPHPVREDLAPVAIEPRSDFKIGSHVMHPNYGPGQITVVANTAFGPKARVRFAVGEREFIISKSPLQLAPDLEPVRYSPLKYTDAKIPDWALADIERDRQSAPPETN